MSVAPSAAKPAALFNVHVPMNASERLARHSTTDSLERWFVAQALQNPFNAAILQRLAGLHLPDGWLVAGCVFQTVWNLQAQRAPDADIKDYDVFYFDPTDLSPTAEQQVQDRVSACFADLPITVEAKNQARVHLWYEDWFGFPYPALASSREGIDRFLVQCTCVGLQPPSAPNSAHAPAVTLYAPHGLEALMAGILRPNPLCPAPSLFGAKARSYQARWDWLSIA